MLGNNRFYVISVSQTIRYTISEFSSLLLIPPPFNCRIFIFHSYFLPNSTIPISHPSTMASTTPKPEKRLGEFLKEQQEPFILEVYLLEKGYSKRWSSKSKGDSRKSLERSSSSCSNQKRKYLWPFSKVLTALHKKLVFHNQSSTMIEDSDNRKEHVDVPHEAASFDRTVMETERFSTASSSTMFHSCSDIDEDHGTSLSSQNDRPWFSPDTGKTSSICNMRVQRYELNFCFTLKNH